MNEKYPRTSHLPFSPGATSDDKIMKFTMFMYGFPLIVTEKMDGGNFTMTSESCYSRSPSATSQPWDSPARALWSSVRHDIPPGWRVVGESMHARRSVAYEGLPGPFLMFAVFNEFGCLLSWRAVQEWSELLGLPLVPVLGTVRDVDEALELWRSSRSPDTSEGFVIRTAMPISAEDFPVKVGKYVRADHVQTSDDWRHRNDYAVNGYKT